MKFLKRLLFTQGTSSQNIWILLYALISTSWNIKIEFDLTCVKKIHNSAPKVPLSSPWNKLTSSNSSVNNLSNFCFHYYMKFVEICFQKINSRNLSMTKNCFIHIVPWEHYLLFFHKHYNLKINSTLITTNTSQILSVQFWVLIRRVVRLLSCRACRCQIRF